MKRRPKRDKLDAPINSDWATEIQKEKANKALIKAKELEQEQQKEGKKYMRLNSKTLVLRKK